MHATCCLKLCLERLTQTRQLLHSTAHGNRDGAVLRGLGGARKGQRCSPEHTTVPQVRRVGAVAGGEEGGEVLLLL